MGNIFLFSLIASLASALVLIPFSRTKSSEGESKQSTTWILVTGIILIFVSVLTFYYVSNQDRNLSSLWIFAIIMTALGTVLSSGKERIIKSILCLRKPCRRPLLSNCFSFQCRRKIRGCQNGGKNRD